MNLLAHPVTAIPDVSARSQPRKLNYPPAFQNLRLFSTPLDHKLFLAGLYLSPIIPQGTSDTNFQHISKEQVFQNDFTPTNVILGPEVPFSEKPVSPPRMDPTFEDIFPLFSPLSEHPDDSALTYEEMGSSNVEQISNKSPERTWPDPPYKRLKK